MGDVVEFGRGHETVAQNWIQFVEKRATGKMEDSPETVAVGEFDLAPIRPGGMAYRLTHVQFAISNPLISEGQPSNVLSYSMSFWRGKGLAYSISYVDDGTGIFYIGAGNDDFEEPADLGDVNDSMADYTLWEANDLVKPSPVS